jgi:hypothetical protein
MMVLKSTGPACTDTSLEILKRDRLLSTDTNNGVKHIQDIAFPYCHPTQANPLSGQILYDVAEVGNGSITIQSSQTVNYAGGGFDFSGLTKCGTYAESSQALSSIWGTGSSNQYFLFCIYLKLPTLANWNTNGVVFEMVKFSAAGTSTYSNSPEFLLIGQKTGGLITFRRQTALGSIDYGDITPNASDYGSVVQLAFWRNSNGQGGRLKSANGTISLTMSVNGNTNNTQNFSALTMKVGVPGGFSGTAVGGTLDAVGQKAINFKYYRSFLENLLISGRDPLTVIDADYSRVISRNVFS